MACPSGSEARCSSLHRGASLWDRSFGRESFATRIFRGFQSY